MSRPIHLNGIVTTHPKRFAFIERNNPQHIKEMGIRNVGVNTLYLSFDGGRNYIDVASGTSFGSEMQIHDFMAKTLFGQTYFTALAIKPGGGGGMVEFTHYPKLEKNLVHSVIWQGEKDIRNTMEKPLGPGESVVGYASAINFTRFYGSVHSDQPIRVRLLFGNDEDDEQPDPRFPDSDELMDIMDPSQVHYDVVAQETVHAPSKKKEPIGEAFFCIIYGKWLKIEVTNEGRKPVEYLRCFTRASVF